MTDDAKQQSEHYERMGRLAEEIRCNKEKLENLKVKLRERAKCFACLAKYIDPDTGPFHKSTTDTVFFKSFLDKPQRAVEFTIPGDTGGIISEAAKLEEKIKRKEREHSELQS